MAAALQQVYNGTGAIGLASAMGGGVTLDEANAGLKPSCKTHSWTPIEEKYAQFVSSPPTYEPPESLAIGRRVMENATNGTGQPSIYTVEIIRQAMIGQNQYLLSIEATGALAVRELVGV